MKIKQPTLNNFSDFSSLNLLSGDAVISKTGIIHTKRAICDICGAKCHYNGSSNRGRHSLTAGNNSFFRKGQQFCPICEKTIQVENSWIDEMILTINEFIASQIISLSESLSEDEIVNHLKSTMGIKISKSKVHSIIKNSNEDLEKIEFDYEIVEGFYGYDEQFIKIDGKRAYRIVIYDLTSNKIIYEKIHYKFSKKILVGILEEVFQEKKKPKGFVTDMRLEYPSAFRKVFGNRVKLQYCIFHLNKLILKEYRDSLKVGKTVKWTLVHYYNMYLLFNIFYDRTYELEKLKNLMKNFDNFKANLTEENVAFYVEKYGVKVKNYDLQKRAVTEIIEKKLLKAFRNVLHHKKNLRKKKKETLKIRSIEDAKEKFEEIGQQKQIYPKKIQKRIERIEYNLEHFIASEGEILTNNRLEGLFGATLKKFRKKCRKSLISFSALLKRKRAKIEGVEFFRKFAIFDLAKIFSACAFFAQ